MSEEVILPGLRAKEDSAQQRSYTRSSGANEDVRRSEIRQGCKRERRRGSLGARWMRPRVAAREMARPLPQHSEPRGRSGNSLVCLTVLVFATSSRWCGDPQLSLPLRGTLDVWRR